MIWALPRTLGPFTDTMGLTATGNSETDEDILRENQLEFRN